jgi:hypothetical protein
MAYNLGSVSTSYNLGYTGVYTGAAEAYVLAAHGTPQANSMMEGNQFATTGPVYFDITGGDTNIANPDWPAINAAQLWLTNINDIAAFNPVAAGSVTYTIDYRVAESGATGTFTRTVNVSEPATVVPQGTWTIGTITKDQNSANFTPTYSASDATSYQYSFNGGAYIAFTGTISLAGLNAEFAYSGNLKALNGAGDGAVQAFSFTTDAVPVAPQVPQGVVITQPPTTTQNTAEIYHSYNEADANSFEYSLDNVNWQAASNPLVLTGLTLNTTGTANFRAVNAVGFGAATSINFRTKGETVIIPSGNWRFFTATTTAPKTWEWGKRHPITNARVRLFKKDQA